MSLSSASNSITTHLPSSCSLWGWPWLSVPQELLVTQCAASPPAALLPQNLSTPALPWHSPHSPGWCHWPKWVGHWFWKIDMYCFFILRIHPRYLFQHFVSIDKMFVWLLFIFYLLVFPWWNVYGFLSPPHFYSFPKQENVLCAWFISTFLCRVEEGNI